ncbi:hypothetical protein E4U16_001088 [Claviceps sp. LM84 group G4]|nr:hypothetical protein E4U16_001088 [Claviceps sp. LM84 group G4]
MSVEAVLDPVEELVEDEMVPQEALIYDIIAKFNPGGVEQQNAEDAVEPVIVEPPVVVEPEPWISNQEMLEHLQALRQGESSGSSQIKNSSFAWIATRL